MFDLQANNYWHKIIAFVPVYDHYGGNASTIYIQGRQPEVDERTVDKILGELMLITCCDERALKNQFAARERRAWIKPLHYRLILVPLKFRNEVVGRDGMHGYINLYYYQNHRRSLEHHGATDIIMADALRLLCYNRLRNVSNKIREAREIARQYYSYHALPAHLFPALFSSKEIVAEYYSAR